MTEEWRGDRLREVATAVETRPKTITWLSNFLKAAEKREGLSRRDRLLIVEQALLLLEMNYVHLPLKRAMHAVDPIQRLKLLRFRLLEMKESELPPAMQFHRRLLEIFASTRDLHTMYLLPEPYRGQVAYLPFLIEQCFEKRKRGPRVEKFIVTRLVERFYELTPNAPPELRLFEPGVEVLYWNGVPIRRAIEINGETQAGSNYEARFARGLDNLTIRPLDTSAPPDEFWVDITYQTRNGKVLTHRQDWMVYTAGMPEKEMCPSKFSPGKRAAIDVKKSKINQVKQSLFVRPHFSVRKSLKHNFYAETRKAAGKEYGYIRLFSFDVDNHEEFVNEFVRVLTSEKFPQEGLILDVRGNGGGRIRAGERLLQLFSPRRIEPELFEFINTPLNLEICRIAPKSWNLSRWAESIAEAVTTGATYSNGFPLNSEAACNDIGQVYFGPVVLITDALSYSTTDIFAAGFQDNEVGAILGTSDNTGAGGANVWWHEDLINLVRNRPKSPFKTLPKGADLVLAMRRSIRVGRNAGRTLEELGITPDRRHFLTKRDILQMNNDLIIRAAQMLKDKPVYSLSMVSFTSAGSRGVVIAASSKIKTRDNSKKIARLDIYRNGRPFKSLDAKNGAIRSRRLVVGRARGRRPELILEAYDGANNLVARCRGLVQGGSS